jgi:hypothetical protein
MAAVLGSRLRGDRVLRVSLLVALADLVVQVFDVAGEAGISVSALVDAGVLTTAMVVLAVRIAGVPGLPAGSRRFWRALSVAASVFVVGQLLDLVVLLAQSPTTVRLHGLGTHLVYPLGDAATVLALMRYPAQERRRSEQVRLWLDVAILTLAAGSFLWYFSLAPNLHGLAGPLDLAPRLLQPVATLVMLLMLAKAVLGGANILDHRAMLYFVAATGASAIAPVLILQFGARAGNVVGMTVQLFVVVGMVRQYRATADGTVLLPQPQRRRRPFSVLPYVAGTATYALLLWVMAPLLLRPATIGVAVLAVALAGVVIVRQLAALHENARLLADNRALTARLEHQAYHDSIVDRKFGAGSDTRVGT